MSKDGLVVSKLRFEIRPSPASNDSEVRILVDGVDWLGPGYLGLDPPELVVELARQRSSGKLIVGRCECGCVGCNDRVVVAESVGETVKWDGVLFDAEQFDSAVKQLESDHSWEDLGRRVERLVAEIFEGSATDDGFAFDWASTRIRPHLVCLSFSKDGTQNLIELGWDGETVESALRRAREMYHERCDRPDGNPSP